MAAPLIIVACRYCGAEISPYGRQWAGIKGPTSQAVICPENGGGTHWPFGDWVFVRLDDSSYQAVSQHTPLHGEVARFLDEQIISTPPAPPAPPVCDELRILPPPAGPSYSFRPDDLITCPQCHHIHPAGGSHWSPDPVPEPSPPGLDDAMIGALQRAVSALLIAGGLIWAVCAPDSAWPQDLIVLGIVVSLITAVVQSAGHHRGH